MIRLEVYILLIVIVTTSALGPDPWDHWQEPDKGIQNANNNDCFSDIFFKKILKIVLARGQIEETEKGNKRISLDFVFSQSEHQKLDKLSSLPVPLTSSELREVYGLLSDRLVEPTYTQVFTEKLIHKISRLISTYYIHALVVISLCIIINYLRYVKWSPVLIVRLSLIILFIIIYLWECKIAVEDANKELYKSMRETPSWWSWITGSNSVSINFDIPSQWEYLHPSKILTKLGTKFVLTPLKEVFLYFDGISNDVSKKFPFPTNSIIYFFLTTLYSVISLLIMSMCIMHICFGIPFKLSYLGFHVHTRRKSTTEHSSRREDGEDVKSLLAASVLALSNMKNSHPIQPINITVNTREIENRHTTNCTTNAMSIKCNTCNRSTNGSENKIEKQEMESATPANTGESSTLTQKVIKINNIVSNNEECNMTNPNDNRPRNIVFKERNLLRKRRKTTEI